MREKLLRLAVASSLIALLAPQASLAQEGGVTIDVKSHAEVGDYLTDGEGMSLYHFEIDTQGKQGTEAASQCYDDCAELWPPLLVESGQTPQAGAAKADLVGTFARTDGKMQVTYNGWPLYYYEPDEAAGDIKGHDIETHGGEWYLVTPEGEPAHD